MELQQVIEKTERCIAYVATSYHLTDEEILAALGGLKDTIDKRIAALPALRAAADTARTAYEKRVEDNRAAVLLKDGKLPEPTTASLGLKV